MNRLLILLILIFTSYSFSFGQLPVKGQEQEWETLRGSNFEIKYPAGWHADTGQQLGTAFIIFSQLSDEEDSFRENVNLLIQDLRGYNMTLDQFVEISENQVNTMITESHIVFNQRQKEGEKEYHKIIYSGKQGIYHLQYEQYYFLQDQKAYVLTLTCERAQFDTYQETGEKILNSFMLKN